VRFRAPLHSLREVESKGNWRRSVLSILGTISGTQEKLYITWKITTEIPGLDIITDIRKEYITRG
jgi:hypothetical protein